MMKTLELNKTKNIISQLEFLELLDLIELLLMKSQHLKQSKIGCFLPYQEIEKKLDRIQFKIELIIEQLRKFNKIGL